MNIDLVLKTGIENITAVYGGVRGITLSSRHNIHHWQTIIESGIHTIIELRKDDQSDRLIRLCQMYNIRYFAFPLDSHSIHNEVIASRLQDFFEIIDYGNFYISCAMGLHRTDMALAIYWIFHGAKLNMDPPYLKGHFPHVTSCRRNVDPSNIFRRLNSLYRYLSENRIIDIPDKKTFVSLRNELIDNSKYLSLRKCDSCELV